MKVSPPLPHQPQLVRPQQRQHCQQANSMMPNRQSVLLKSDQGLVR